MDEQDIENLDIKDREKDGLSVLKKNADMISAFVTGRDYDWFHLVVGREGVGKSSFAVLFSKLLDPSFGVDRVVFSYEDFKRAVVTSDPGQVILVDEGGLLFFCLDKKEKVITNEGIKTLEDLSGKEKLVSFNFKTGKKEFVTYKKWKSRVKKVYKIHTKEGVVKCSATHKWFVKKKNGDIVEKMACQLKAGDELARL